MHAGISSIVLELNMIRFWIVGELRRKDTALRVSGVKIL